MARRRKTASTPHGTARVEFVPLNDVKTAKDNPKKHDIEELKASIKRFGFIAPMLYNEATGSLVAGHGRRQALLELREAGEPMPAGLGEDWAVPIIHGLAFKDEREAKAYLVADNRLVELGGWSNEDLVSMLGDIRSNTEDALAGVGYSDEDLELMLNPTGATEGAGGNGAAGIGEVVNHGALSTRFLVPPFTVLNARDGWWRDRKRLWLSLGIQSETGRDGLGDTSMATRYDFFNDGELLAGDSGSIFDPVLCELAYSWFSPLKGKVFDPFAGGSVRGIIAAQLGRAYHGVELRKVQVEANRKQWEAISKAFPVVTKPDPMRVEEHDGFQVVRHDAHPGGTKQAVFERLLAPGGAWAEHDELVYATPAQGFAQLGLAAACKAVGKKATIFLADCKRLPPITQAAVELGATVKLVPPPKYLNSVQRKAREYCKQTGAFYMPFGGEVKEVQNAIRDIALELPIDPPAEVWTVAGSGTLTRGLQLAWPDAKFHAVQIGKDPQVGKATLHKSTLKYEEESKHPPPFNSNLNYDAKAWTFIKEHASPGALFWNVGGDPSHPGSGDIVDRVDPVWEQGDSLKVKMPKRPDADLVFSCPPYADLEKYSDDPADISNMPYDQFLEAYRQIIKRACQRLKPDRFAVWVVGDVRDSGGRYRGFVADTIAAFMDAGLAFYNEAILVTPAGTLPLRAGRQFAVGRKLGKCHQNVLVFVKGDPKAAAKACGNVVVHVPGDQPQGDTQ